MSALLLATLLSWSSAQPLAVERTEAGSFAARDLQGRRVRLDDLRGRVVVLAFWATWCTPCLAELRHLDELQRRRGAQGLSVIAVAGDGPETASRVSSLARQQRWQMSVIHDVERRVFARFNPTGETPWLVVIDKHGRIAWTHGGYAPGDEHALAATVATALDEP
ncbi:MAG: TlpA family protein disulfide reductase [Deltaproteobacteria bacterium]|nr:TlpA family protein disulfide reductase [Deltaproteobacteria bacterium]